MVRNDARFHLTMSIAAHSHSRANAFDALFNHVEKQRSSDKAEMQEINEFWVKQLRPVSRIGADIAAGINTQCGIDHWLKEIEDKLMVYILREWKP